VRDLCGTVRGTRCGKACEHDAVELILAPGIEDAVALRYDSFGRLVRSDSKVRFDFAEFDATLLMTQISRPGSGCPRLFIVERELELRLFTEVAG